MPSREFVMILYYKRHDIITPCFARVGLCPALFIIGSILL